MNPNEWFQPAVPHQPNTTQAPNATPQIQQPAPQMRNASVQGLPNTQPQYLVTPQGQVVVSANGVPQAPAYIQPVQGQPPAVASQLNAYISAETQPQIDEGPINTISLSANILFWLGIFLAAVLVLVCIVVITGQTSTSQKVSRLIITILDIVAASGMVVIGHRLKDLVLNIVKARSVMLIGSLACGVIVILSAIELGIDKKSIPPLQGVFSLGVIIYLFLARSRLKGLS